MEFTHDGLLPPGEYPLRFAKLRASMLVTGDGVDSPTWDADWRGHLVDQLEVLTRQLWAEGIDPVFADGSFVEDKDHPNDIDGYFEAPLDRLASGELQRALNLRDPHKCWTWLPAARRPYRGYPKLQLPMWHRYRVELYPHVPQLFSGITDELGNQLEFPAAFRRSRRSGGPRGIIRLTQD
ncbi:MAG: hypothetical protein ISR76_05205 [Planctomycetes bacterium]|nr:hypothetical protein [Planctomycetota bacterium]MBL7008375.1 hypothetical protein [Planctomycetota bacterium]